MFKDLATGGFIVVRTLVHLSVPMNGTEGPLTMTRVRGSETSFLATEVAPRRALFLSRHHLRFDGNWRQSVRRKR